MIYFLEFEQEGIDINSDANEGVENFKKFLNERIRDAR